MPDSTVPEGVLHSIMDSLPDGVMVVDEDAIVQYVNPAAAALLQSSPGALVGKPFAHRLEVGACFDIDVAGRGGARSIKAEVRVAHMTWQGKPAYLASLRDVSARAELEDLRSRLLRADKRSAIAQLSTSIAHEINNPAAFILANLAVMKDIIDDFEAAFEEARINRAILDKYQIRQSLGDVRDMLQDNEHGIERIRSFMRELKSLTKESAGETELVELGDVVQTACEVAASSIDSRIRLERALEPTHELVGERFRLVQVVVNLILNAADAIARSGKPHGRIEVATSSDDGSVRITVRDTGGGLPEENLDKIFDPLFVPDPAEGTLGVGLAISSEIVGNHGGRIEVTSKVGEGSCFEIILPRDTGLSLPESGPNAAPGQVRARVLLIDDDAAMRRSIRRMLDSLHDVIEVHGGKAALDHLASDRDYDVVLCALSMGELDGPALHAALEEQAPELVARMVFIGDGTRTPRLRRFVEAARAMVLEKPVSRTLLCDVIERRSR